MDLMQELNQTHGQTFVIVTHDARIGAMTNHIIRMKDGLIQSTESTTNGGGK
jgi:putative ABC transport system ATP-binding protein